jgi:CTD kinase subunit gamma
MCAWTLMAALANSISVSSSPSAVTVSTATTPSSRKRAAPVSTEFSRSDTLKRMEEDRERHKRLREKMWVIPLPFAASRTSAIVSNAGKGSTPQMTPSPATPISPSANAKVPIENPAAIGTKAFFQEAAAGAMEEDFGRLWEWVGDLEEEDLVELKL